MCPMFDVASSILRAWSQDRRRSRGNSKYNPKHRECLAVNQYCEQAVKSKEVNMDKGKVAPYVDGAYQSLLECKSPSGVKVWHKGQRRKLSDQKQSGRKEYKSWVKGIKDNKVKQVSEKIQVPLMLKLMKQAGMKPVTIEFIRKVFSEGAEYIDNVDISGVYPELPVQK